MMGEKIEINTLITKHYKSQCNETLKRLKEEYDE